MASVVDPSMKKKKMFTKLEVTFMMFIKNVDH